MKCTKCNHVWGYKGKSGFYVTCPRCLRKVKINKNKEVKNVRNN
jgi:Zn finger protein HypA/HybF involved in hydrogenase expression